MIGCSCFTHVLIICMLFLKFSKLQLRFWLVLSSSFNFKKPIGFSLWNIPKSKNHWSQLFWNQWSTCFAYFKSIKELVVFTKDSTKNWQFAKCFFDFFLFLRTMAIYDHGEYFENWELLRKWVYLLVDNLWVSIEFILRITNIGFDLALSCLLVACHPCVIIEYLSSKIVSHVSSWKSYMEFFGF